MKKYECLRCHEKYNFTFSGSEDLCSNCVSLEYECRSCGESYGADDLVRGICDECQDAQELNMIRRM